MSLEGSGTALGRRHRFRWVRALAVLAVAAVVMVAVVMVTGGEVFARRQPQLALKMAPWHAGASASLARQALVRSRRPTVLSLAEQLSVASFLRDPTETTAITNLALIATVRADGGKASRIFRYAERLTRRDEETQLWLIEWNVRRNDIPGALRHYDRALSTKPYLWPTLFPILVSASSSPQISTQLNRLLRTRPNWARDFLNSLAAEGRDATAMLAVSRNVLRPAEVEDRAVLKRLLKRLTEIGAFDQAWGLYRQIAADPAAASLPVRDGGFRGQPAWPPMDWEFAEDGRLAPELRSRSGSEDLALFLPGRAPISGDAARQLLRLRPGAYRLIARVGGVSDAAPRPSFSVRCTGREGAPLLDADLPAAGEAGTSVEFRLRIPADCLNQWLAIKVRANSDLDVRAQPWLDSVSIRPA